jgi:hypothetical protein
LVEILFIYQEKYANKTTVMHYTLICFNGKFGFVPFTEILVKEIKQDSEESTLNYDDIGSKVLCLKY